MAGRGRPISRKYERRIAAIAPETENLRYEVKTILHEELENATQAELYDRTTLPTTGRMMRSVRASIRGARVVAFYDARIAKHAKYRVNMKGISKSGGHVLNMNPAKWLRRRANPRIRRRAVMAKRRIWQAK
jgi:hypothetical protein